MNLKSILIGAAALTLVVTVKADVTIDITGATAFRAAAVNTIKARFDAGTGYKYAHDSTTGNVSAANLVVFQGNFPSISGVTTIRCAWNGSTEGIRAVALGGTHNPAFLTTAALHATNQENPGQTGPTTTTQPKFTFSDVRQSSSPVTSPVLNPTNAAVGVVTFAPIVNEGAPVSFTNVNAQQFKALFTIGNLPLRVFTGAAADTIQVFATGRNDGSGTRTTYMAESGLGIANLVNQYIATAKSSTAFTTIRRVPQANGTNASTLWGNDVDGNGGYSSGSTLRGDMGLTSGAVTVLDSDNTDIFGNPQNILLVTFLATSDAVTARTNGARILGWNGVTLDSLNSGTALSAADKAKVTEGAYTAWGYQQFYYRGSLSTDENQFYTQLKNNISANLGNSGIPLTDMHVGRSDDGAYVSP